MPRTATASLRDLLGTDLMASLARILSLSSPSPSVRLVHDADPIEVDADPELEPFLDWDTIRGRGRGFFRSDRDECATRRVDLRGPTDLDPGPLPMDDADDELETGTVQWLQLAPLTPTLSPDAGERGIGQDNAPSPPGRGPA